MLFPGNCPLLRQCTSHLPVNAAVKQPPAFHHARNTQWADWRGVVAADCLGVERRRGEWKMTPLLVLVYSAADGV